MYQALYRKWRPRTFDDVVGQEHITETLKRQVAANRLSHAYLFTGTRGTGKTTCAKILARAVNCENPQNGNPCNACPSCLGIENGSILDVLELDAASNNGVDQIRALRDEAVYTPTAVRMRVYIVDEVHMLSNAAFNALLKILEEPPEHLMFILATTEVQKVLTTIKSRCQQFSFKRILPDQIIRRLNYVSIQEQINLSPGGARLLARLADGGMRDALSLLDQCSGNRGEVNEKVILDTLGLAGNVETARLLDKIAKRDTAAVLDIFGKLYANGKDVGAILDELSALTRDLLLLSTAPKTGTALMTGGYDDQTMRVLSRQLTGPRLLQILTILQQTMADLPRSSNRRTDGELCLIRLSDQQLDSTADGLSVRIAQAEQRAARAETRLTKAAAYIKQVEARVAELEEKLANGIPVQAAAGNDGMPAWDEEPPLPDEPPDDMEERDYSLDVPQDPAPQSMVKTTARSATRASSWTTPPAAQPVQQPMRSAAPACTAPASPVPPRSTAARSTLFADPAAEDPGDRSFWVPFVMGLKGKYPVLSPVLPTLVNSKKVAGVWKNGHMTLWVDNEFTRKMLNKPAITAALARDAAATFGQPVQVAVVVGEPPAETATVAPAANGTGDALDELLAFGQYDNITIQ